MYCLIYVLPLHLSPAARAAPNRSRDDPIAIRVRIRAVSLSTAACSLATLVLRLPAGDAWHQMGYWPQGLLDAAASVALTALLFAAPLYERLVIDGYWKDCLRLEPLANIWSEWPTWRNLVAVSHVSSSHVAHMRLSHIIYLNTHPPIIIIIIIII